MTLFGKTVWIDLNFSIDSITTLVTDYMNWSWLHLTTKHVYLDKKAFNEATIVTVTVPLVYCLTWSDITINGLVPKGISLIFHGLSLNLVNIVANDFIAITSDDLVKSFYLPLITW